MSEAGMSFQDILWLGLRNMRARPLRFFLTTFGVTIGIAMLLIMMSVGVGIQKNTIGRLQSTDVFTSLTVSSDVITRGGPFARPRTQIPRPAAEAGEAERPVLDDAALERFARLEGVRYVYPQSNLTAQLKNGKKTIEAVISVMPVGILQDPVYTRSLESGSFFASDAEDSVVISERVAQRLGFAKGAQAVGQSISLMTLANLAGFSAAGIAFEQKETPVKVAGVYNPRRGGSTAGLGIFGFAGVIASKGLAERAGGMQLSLNALFGMMSGKKNYGLAHVRVQTPKNLDPVRKEIEKLGFSTVAAADFLGQMKIVLIILDSILGIIGSIALVVSLLGIVNTLLMSILERTREIGIMKAIGGEDWDIQKIFFIEAGAIGFIGGCAGIVLGWSGAVIVNWIINRFIAQQGGEPTQVLVSPWWLILSSVLFAILVSLLAGIYPSRRAARIDPVIALRHD